MIIAGLDVKKGDNIVVKSSKNILPNVLKDSFQRLIEISAANEHAVNKGANEEQQANSRQTSMFLDSTFFGEWLWSCVTLFYGMPCILIIMMTKK